MLQLSQERPLCSKVWFRREEGNVATSYNCRKKDPEDCEEKKLEVICSAELEEQAIIMVRDKINS